MRKIAVFANDAAFAGDLLRPLLEDRGATHWVLVACSPAPARHIGRWMSRSAHQQWLVRWGGELFDELEPQLRAHPSSSVEKLLARRPLTEVSARLQARLGKLRLLDARRPRGSAGDEPLFKLPPPMPGAASTAHGILWCE